MSGGYSEFSRKRKSLNNAGDGPDEKKNATVSVDASKDINVKKIEMNVSKSKPVAAINPVKMTLGKNQLVTKPVTKEPVSTSKPMTVASVFNQDDSDSEEELPPEARMRMKNIGRKTKTSAGPNSFGKEGIGFCDRAKMLERKLIAEMKAAGELSDS